MILDIRTLYVVTAVACLVLGALQLVAYCVAHRDRSSEYLYRAVDKDGSTIDFLLRAHRDKPAARHYFEKPIARNDVPETVTIDKSGTNLTALEAINADREAPIRIRQSKYLNNLAENDDFPIKMSSIEHRLQTFPLVYHRPLDCWAEYFNQSNEPTCTRAATRTTFSSAD